VSGPAAIALTVGLVTRHFQNRAGGWDPAMLDIAQDHALCRLYEQGLFDLGLVFKGARRFASAEPVRPAGSPPIWTSPPPKRGWLVWSCPRWTATAVMASRSPSPLLTRRPGGRTSWSARR